MFDQIRRLSSVLLTWSIVVAAGPCISGPQARESTEPVVDHATVRRWVARLDADRRAERQRAEDELLKLGPQALPWLPEPESVSSRATAEAIRRIRAKLERAQAEISVEATYLSAEARTSLGEVLSRLTKETGNLLTMEQLPPELLAKPLELPDRPTFWQALEAASRQHELSWSFEGSPARLRLIPTAQQPDEARSRSTPLAVTFAKAFRIAIVSLGERAVVGQDSPPLVRLELDVASEPRLRPLFLKCAVSEINVHGSRASSKGTQRWAPFSPDAKVELTFGQGRRQLAVPLDFLRPNGNWESLSVSGRLHVETAASEEPIEFPPGAEAAGVSRRRGGVTVKVLRWEPTDREGNHRLDVTALVTYDTGGPAFESHRSWMLFNVAGLVRAGTMPNEKSPRVSAASDVALLKPTHTESDVQPDGSIAVAYRFEKLPLPAAEYRFRYVAPTRILDVPLEFHLRDIPLRSGR